MAKLLEFMSITKKSLGEVDKETARLNFVKKNVTCPWHLKGRVMRQLMKHSEGAKRELIEGVKLFLDERAHTSILLNPDRARPVFHINAESADLMAAQRLASEYEANVKRWAEQE